MNPEQMSVEELLSLQGYRSPEMARRLRLLEEAIAQCEAENALPKPSWLREIIEGRRQ